MRPWLALTHAGAEFAVRTVTLPHMETDSRPSTPLAERRALGSVRGLFPVLRVDGEPIHESLAICEYVAESFPEAGLWPQDTLSRAKARAICCEMVSGFTAMRTEMSCQLFARVPGFSPGDAARADVARLFEIWQECLERSGGPFLFGRFGIADAMLYPMRTRLRTYGVPLAPEVVDYARALDESPAVRKLIDFARGAPRIPVYDAHVRRLGGDPDAALAD